MNIRTARKILCSPKFLLEIAKTRKTSNTTKILSEAKKIIREYRRKNK